MSGSGCGRASTQTQSPLPRLTEHPANSPESAGNGRAANKQTNPPCNPQQSLAPGWRQALKGTNCLQQISQAPAMDPTPKSGCPSLPWVLLSTRGAHNCWKLSWRDWNALHHLQHPTWVPEETSVGLSPVLQTMGQICGLMLVIPNRRESATQHPPGSATSCVKSCLHTY